MQSAAVVKLSAILLISHLPLDWVVIQGALHVQQHVQQYAVHTARTGFEALRLLFAIKPDLIMLNETLPDLAGEQLCRRIRNFTDTPILFLSETKQTELVQPSLPSDYITIIPRPLHPSTLLGHVQQALRQNDNLLGCPPKNGEIETASDSIILDHQHYQVIVQGVAHKLSASEYHLLSYLLENSGQILSHHQLREALRDTRTRNHVKDLYTLIWRVRRKIETDPQHPHHLISQYGIGYSFERKGIIELHS